MKSPYRLSLNDPDGSVASRPAGRPGRAGAAAAEEMAGFEPCTYCAFRKPIGEIGAVYLLELHRCPIHLKIEELERVGIEVNVLAHTDDGVRAQERGAFL